MRIIHVEDCFLPTSGYQINFLAKWNKLHNHDVTIVTGDSLKPWLSVGFIDVNKINDLDKKFKEDTGVDVIRVKSLFRYSGREYISSKIFNIIKKLKPDAVVVHGSDTLTGIRFAVRIKDLYCAVVFDNHMVEIASKNPLAPAFRFFMSKVITPIFIKYNIPIVAVSDSTRRFITDRYKIPEWLVSVIPLGTDTSLFFPSTERKNSIRHKLGIKDNDFVCIYTGKISEDKKVKLLAEAFAKKISFFGRNIVLLLVGSGSGSYYHEVFYLLSQSENKVIHVQTQPVDRLPDFYRAADLAIWPGAASLSVYDAAASGLILALEDIDINRERSKDLNAFLFEPDSIEGIRNTIKNVLSLSKDKSAEIIERTIKVVRAKYSYDMIASEFESLIESQIRRRMKTYNNYPHT